MGESRLLLALKVLTTALELIVSWLIKQHRCYKYRINIKWNYISGDVAKDQSRDFYIYCLAYHLGSSAKYQLVSFNLNLCFSTLLISMPQSLISKAVSHSKSQISKLDHEEES